MPDAGAVIDADADVDAGDRLGAWAPSEAAATIVFSKLDMREATSAIVVLRTRRMG